MNSSKLLDKAVEQFASLPGVGRKTALKFVLHLLKRKPEEVASFVQSITNLKTNIRECKVCHNIADSELCEICADKKEILPPSVLLRISKISSLLKELLNITDSTMC